MLIYRKSLLNKISIKQNKIPDYLLSEINDINTKLEKERKLYEKKMNEIEIYIFSPNHFEIMNDILKEKKTVNSEETKKIININKSYTLRELKNEIKKNFFTGI